MYCVNLIAAFHSSRLINTHTTAEYIGSPCTRVHARLSDNPSLYYKLEIRPAVKLMMLGGVGWCWVVLGGVGWCWVVLGGVGWCWVVLGGVGWCWVVLGGVGWCWVVLGGVGWCWVVLGGVEWCWVMLGDVDPSPRPTVSLPPSFYSSISPVPYPSPSPVLCPVSLPVPSSRHPLIPSSVLLPFDLPSPSLLLPSPSTLCLPSLLQISSSQFHSLFLLPRCHYVVFIHD